MGGRARARAATRSWSRPPASASRPGSRSRSRTTSTRRSARASRPPAIEALWAHQADALEAARRGHAIVTTGTASGKSLAFNLPVLDTLASDVAARAFYLYPTKALAQDQARGLAQDRRPLPPPRDLRRRHAARGAALDQAALEPDPHEPGHAPRGGAAEPPLVGRRARQPRLGGGGRGARVPRRVRLARGERAAAAAAAGARLRHRAALPAHERHDREPDRARRAADRRGGRARGPRRRAAGRAPDRHVEPAARGREARPARLRPRRGVQPARVARGARDPHDLLPEVAPRRGADPALHAPAARGRGPQRPRRADRALPGRLHAGAAARDRAAAVRWRPAGRRGHGRARARHRHRRPRRGAVRDVPRHGRVAAPDVGPRRPPQHRPRHVRGGRGRARPVLLPPPHRVPRAAGGAGDPRPRVRADPRGASLRRGVRAAAHARGRARSSGRAGRSTRAGWSSRARCASAAGSTCRAAPATRRRGSRSGRRRPTRCPSSRRAAAR